MPRTRKSAQTPSNQDPPNTDEGDAATMAHLPADELAGSPDIFAAKRSSSSDTVATTSTDPASQRDVPADVPTSSPEPAATATEPMVAPLEPPATNVGLPPPMAPTPAPHYVPPPAPVRRNGAGIALGVVLVVVGLFYLVVQIAAVDLSSFGWPLFVIVPGVTLLIVGILSLGTG
ncbi:MAG TPA: hypothetical protein VHW94_02510, partial [Candidatus Dormibacteraeota bacterium]|nr:hypothetical protein [Candidatus Dormibacteraeota bacterium]